MRLRISSSSAAWRRRSTSSSVRTFSSSERSWRSSSPLRNAAPTGASSTGDGATSAASASAASAPGRGRWTRSPPWTARANSVSSLSTSSDPAEKAARHGCPTGVASGEAPSRSGRGVSSTNVPSWLAMRRISWRSRSTGATHCPTTRSSPISSPAGMNSKLSTSNESSDTSPALSWRRPGRSDLLRGERGKKGMTSRDPKGCHSVIGKNRARLRHAARGAAIHM